MNTYIEQKIAIENKIDVAKDKALGLVIPTQKQFQLGEKGFLFDIPEEARLELQGSITDNPIENGGNVHDHITYKPITLTLRGFIGEVVFTKEDFLFSETLGLLSEKLGIIGSYLPILTPGASQKINDVAINLKSKVDYYLGAINQGKKLVDLFNPPNANDTKQTKAFKSLETSYKQKELFNVITPWTALTNMMLSGIIATQTNGALDNSQFSITLKQVQFAQTKVTNFDLKNYSERAKEINSIAEDKGIAQGQQVDQSLLSKGFNAIQSGNVNPLNIFHSGV